MSERTARWASIAGRAVDNVPKRHAALEAAQIIGEQIDNLVPVSRSKAGRMRGNHDVRQRPERTLRLERLAIEDVEHRAANLTSAERGNQCRGIDDLAAGDIHDHCSLIQHRY